jgi:hypothetical protein
MSSQEKSYSEDKSTGANGEGVDTSIRVQQLIATSIMDDQVKDSIGERFRKVNDCDRDNEYLKKSPGFDKSHCLDTNDEYHGDVNLDYRLSSEAFVR